jgi:hypothetical protein
MGLNDVCFASENCLVFIFYTFFVHFHTANSPLNMWDHMEPTCGPTDLMIDLQKIWARNEYVTSLFAFIVGVKFGLTRRGSAINEPNQVEFWHPELARFKGPLIEPG